MTRNKSLKRKTSKTVRTPATKLPHLQKKIRKLQVPVRKGK